MPRPPSPESLTYLREFTSGARDAIAPSGKVWDTRIAQAGTPEAFIYILEGWEIIGADAMPSQDKLDQLLHFRKQVPVETMLGRARKLLERCEEVPDAG